MAHYFTKRELADMEEERRASKYPRDDREPKACPRCGELCVYDGWDHVHRSGLGIGSCEDDPQQP
jgi:hypothetical protein